MMLEHWSGWVFAHCGLGLIILLMGGVAMTSSSYDENHPASKGLVVVMVLFGLPWLLAAALVYGILFALGKGVEKASI